MQFVRSHRRAPAILVVAMAAAALVAPPALGSGPPEPPRGTRANVNGPPGHQRGVGGPPGQQDRPAVDDDSACTVACAPIGIPVWTDQAGWAGASRASSIGLADVDGDGNPELLGRSVIGLEVWTFEAGTCTSLGDDCGQWVPFQKDPIAVFSDANGSSVDAGGRIVAADLDGDGSDEIVGWTAGGHVVAFTWDAATGGFVGPEAVPGLGTLTRASEYETLMVSDVNGNGRQEVGARTPAGLRLVEKDAGGGWVALPALTGMRDGTTWEHNSWEWRTVMPANVSAGPADEIVGHGEGAIVAWRFDVGTTSWVELPSIHDTALPATDWRLRTTSGSFQPLDRDGDGVDELVVVGTSDVYLLALGGSSWSHQVVADKHELLPGFLDVAVENGAVMAAQLDSQPGQELVIHDGTGLVGHAFARDGTTRIVQGPAFSFSRRFDNANARAWFWPDDGSSTAELIVGRAIGGIQTAQNVAPTVDPPVYRSPSTPFPVFTGDELIAYQYISRQVGATNAGGVRSHYADTPANIQADINALPGSPPMAVPPEVFTRVRDQVHDELNAALRVAGHYQALGEIYTDVFAVDSSRAATVADVVEADAQDEVDNQPLELTRNILETIHGGLGEIPEVGGFLAGAASAVDVALSYFETQPHNGDFHARISQMDTQWADRFAQMQSELGAQRAAVVVDYGLLRTIAASIADGSWAISDGGGDATNRGQLVRGMERGGELTFYQALVPLGFEVWYCRKGDRWNIACTLGSTDPPANTVVTVGDERSMWLAHPYERDKLGFLVTWGDGIRTQLADKLFGEPAVGCGTVWTSECSFGLDPAEVYRHQAGWRDLVCASSLATNFFGADLFFRYHRPCDRLPPSSEWIESVSRVDEDGGWSPGRPTIPVTIDGVEHQISPPRQAPASHLLQFVSLDPEPFDLAEVLPNGRFKHRFADDELVMLRPNANFVTIEVGPS